MTRLWSEGHPIHVYVSFDGQPRRFTWHNHTYRIVEIQQQWQVDTDWWDEAGRVWRDYVAVVTKEGLLCVLYQDLLSDQWYLSKVYD